MIRIQCVDSNWKSLILIDPDEGFDGNCASLIYNFSRGICIMSFVDVRRWVNKVDFLQLSKFFVVVRRVIGFVVSQCDGTSQGFVIFLRCVKALCCRRMIQLSDAISRICHQYFFGSDEMSQIRIGIARNAVLVSNLKLQEKPIF